MTLVVEQKDLPDAEWVSAKGEVDLYTSPQLRSALMRRIPKMKAGKLILDLSGVSYMDSSGVATLVEALKAARDAKAGFVLAAPSIAVMKVLQLARLDAVFEIQTGPVSGQSGDVSAS